MFGYIKPDYPYLYIKDETLYKALYCGMCRAIKKESGNLARLSLTYDIAFMSLLVHCIKGENIKVEKAHCISHPIKKIPVSSLDDTSLMLADVNVILARYKATDDYLDEKKGSLKKLVTSKGYKLAKKRYPKIDEIVKTCYTTLIDLEKSNSDSIDIVCDCFATMLEKISCEVLQEFSTEYTRQLFYMVGKWIYLIDALDDYDKDIKKNNYNVFRSLYKRENYDKLISNHYQEIVNNFGLIFSQISEVMPNIKFHFNQDLLQNIIYRGLPQTTKKILEKGQKKNDK